MESCFPRVVPSLRLRFLIGYGAVARFNDVDEKPPQYSRMSKDGTVTRIRYSRGARQAIATIVKVAGISTSKFKAEELDIPLAGRAGVVGGTGVPTAGAAAAESIISSRKESDKSSSASGAGDQGFGAGSKVALVDGHHRDETDCRYYR
jgi:hypothetical protein